MPFFGRQEHGARERDAAHAAGGKGKSLRKIAQAETIHPKRPNTLLKDLQLEKPYFQVFVQKHGFQSDLSSIDLLFNEGPDSIVYLKKI